MILNRVFFEYLKYIRRVFYKVWVVSMMWLVGIFLWFKCFNVLGVCNIEDNNVFFDV